MRRLIRISCEKLLDIKPNVITNRSMYTSILRARTCLQLDWDTTKETIFHNLNYGQQKRSYAPEVTTNCKKCWNCEKEPNSECSLMQCPYCGSLQDIKTDINFFELFDFPPKFDLDAQALTKSFRQLQTVVHPDKFSNKSSREQSNSANWSSFINKAYKTLSIPIERGQYLLKLNGLQMPQDNSVLDKQFLMEMMERNEEVDDAATSKELNALNVRLSQEIKEKVVSLTEAFSENNLELAKNILVELKYLLSIQTTIKNKEQTLFVS